MRSRKALVIVNSNGEKYMKFKENWLQVLATTKLSEIDEGEGKEFETEVMAGFGFKAQQQALELIFPSESPFHREASFIQHGIKKALASPLGLLPIARILFDIGLQPRIEDRLAIGFAVKARIQIEHSPAQIKPYFPGHSLEVLESLGQ